MEPESGQPAGTVPRATAGAGGVRQRQQHETTGLPFHLAPVISRPTGNDPSMPVDGFPENGFQLRDQRGARFLGWQVAQGQKQRGMCRDG